MKLVSFLASGHPSYGIVSGDGIMILAEDGAIVMRRFVRQLRQTPLLRR